MRVTCRICLRTLYRAKARPHGGQTDSHDRCREVVAREILDKPRPMGRPPKPRAAVPQKSILEAVAGSSCEFCARVHGNGQEALVCRQRAERAAADVRGWR